MRTCPACGKDTEAGSVEPCTECGFSPADPAAFETESDPRFESVGFDDDQELVDEEPTFAVDADDAAPAPAPADSAPPAPPADGDPVSQPKKRSWARPIVWVVVIAAIGLTNVTGLFDDPPGPSAEEVEAALEDWATAQGGTLTVDCPSDAEDTEVGSSFDCIATNQRGQTRTVTVNNNEDDFSWDGTPMIELIRRDR